MSKKYVTTCNSPEADEKWKIESDLRTLISAAEVMNDKGRLKAAKALAVEQKADLEALLKGDTE